MTHNLARCMAMAIALCAAAPGSTSAREWDWRPAGSLIDDVHAGNAFALADGRVVSVGFQQFEDAWPATTQIWSPKTKSWSATAARPATARLKAGVAVMLDDGRILVTGFCSKNCGRGANAELYDPATDTWSLPKQMQHGRYFHAMVKLLDGRVLVLGGCTSDPCLAGTTEVEVFDPHSGRFTTLSSHMNIHRICFSATLLKDGRVLVAGGYNPSGVLSSDETYDPATDGWAVNAPMPHPHVLHASALLNDGRVLIAGGDCFVELPCADAELFDPSNATWRSAGKMSAPRSAPATILLRSGEVLIAGGLSYSGTLWQKLPTCEAFDPVRAKFADEEEMAAQRSDFSLAMLPNGKVLAVGGDEWEQGDNKTPGTAELYGR